MMNSILIICEGKHDVAFLKVILEKRLKFSNYQVSVKNIEKPVGDYLIKKIRDFEYDESRLRDGPKLPIILKKKKSKNVIYAILYSIDGLNSQGLTRAKELIKDYLDLITLGRTVPGFSKSKMSLGFIFDSDSHGLEQRCEWVKNQFSDEHLDLSNLNHNTIIDHDVFSGIGVYSLAGEDGFGNLESILLPIYSRGQDDQADYIKKFLTDNNFERLIEGKKHDRKTNSDLDKSLIAILGQFEFSGFANAELIFKSKRIGGLLDGSELVNGLEGFLNKLKKCLD